MISIPTKTGRSAALFLAGMFLFAFVQTAAAQKTRIPESKEQIRLSYAPVVSRAAPAVVNVFVRKQTRRSSRRTGDPFRDFFNRQFRIPGQRARNSLGSGVLVSADGLVVTNYHVIKGGEDAEITVVLADKREFPARIILKEEKTDLAVMRLEAPGVTFPFIELDDSDDLQVGDIVFAIGNPFGFGQTVTSGIVSALARTRVGISDYQFFIQTDAAINPGNSGGALIDINGKLIGVNSAIYSRTGASHGIGFAIPSNMVQIVVQSAIQGKAIKRPWLGARLRRMTSDIAESLGMDRPTGALVEQLWRDGPADEAGIRPGDVIVSVDGKEVFDPRSFRYRFGTKGVGGKVEVGVLRDGKPASFKIALVSPPEKPARDEREISGRNPFSGARVANISPAVADELSLDQEDEGVAVLTVKRRSSAGRWLRAGDIIVSVNGKQVTSTRQLETLVRNTYRRWNVSFQRNKRVLNIIIGG